MNLTFMRGASATALAIALAGCGGKASFPVNVSVTGLSNDNLVLTTNGMDLAVPKSATSLAFPNSLSYGDVYDVVIKTQPAHQSCVVSGGSDTAGRLAAINILVQCVLNDYTVGGSVTGLTSAGLILTNGTAGGSLEVAAAASAFTFPTEVPYSVSYGISVLAQPANEVCSVTQNGTGTMGDAAITNIVVACVPKT